MPDEIIDIGGVRAYVCAPDGPVLSTTDTHDLIGQAMFDGAELVVIPAERLGDDFFTLRTGVAGELLQKFVNYHLRLAVLGDISARVAASPALRDFVYEANRGRHAWFLPDRPTLNERLAAARR